MAKQPSGNGVDAVSTARITAEIFAAITGTRRNLSIGFNLQDAYGTDFPFITRASVIDEKRREMPHEIPPFCVHCSTSGMEGQEETEGAHGMVDTIQKRQLLRESVCRSLMEAFQTGKGAAEEAAILRGYARTLALTYDENLLQAVRWMWGNENSTTEQAVLLAECMAGCFEAMAALLVKAKDGEGGESRRGRTVWKNSKKSSASSCNCWRRNPRELRTRGSL